MKCNSRIDAYNFIYLVLIVGALALPNLFFHFSWIYFVVMLILDVVLIVTLFSTRYELTETELIIKSGLIKFGVSLSSITSITKTKNYLSSSCGTAVKCVEICFGQDKKGRPHKLSISPEKEEEFLSLLLSFTPGVKEIQNKREKN